MGQQAKAKRIRQWAKQQAAADRAAGKEPQPVPPLPPSFTERREATAKLLIALEQAQAENKKLRAQRAEEMKDAEAAFAELTAERDQLRAQAENLEAARSELTEQVQRLEADKAHLAEQVADLTEQLQSAYAAAAEAQS